MRVTLCIEIEADAVALAILRRVLGDPIRARWLRNRLEAALEQFLAWVAEGTAYRVRVSGGRFTVNPDEGSGDDDSN